ncbi:hypothetical protein CY34DRAFT_802009 [Suillus luteus UH-Slu-Lm8-n1]|uniref:DDE-1 domain-containing protein n=1 Tax=Suillus luteus UH-Slu-Lm8-n1 TaxID=930992 RepID=A0A0D0A4N7_9AGAM|nr:hypothetical protein CY34DRAFT_802009 [Suillus luteus UH-Slu-Lm8-n1]
MAKPRGLDPKRAQNFNKKTVGDYFNMRKEVDNKYNKIPPEHNWNMDEKGNQMGGGRKGDGTKYIFWIEDKDRYRMHSDNLELVTILECVNAAGTAMPPFFVLSDGPVADHGDIEGIGGIATSPNGWTDQAIGEFWFTKVFLPNAEKCRVDQEKPIVLNMDGHNSHETDAIKVIAYDHGVIIIAFPSKTTHKLQPLDVGVFSSVQRKWISHCDKRLAEGIKMNRYNFIPEYMSIRHVITPALVQKAFQRTGIHPLNPDVFTDKDFAPSQATSTTTHVPTSYPEEVPSSPVSATMAVSEDESDSEYMESDDEVSDSLLESEEDEGFYFVDPLTGPSTSRRSTRSSSVQFTGPILAMPSYAQCMTRSREELWDYISRLHSQNRDLMETVATQSAQLEAANAHCTVVSHENTQLREIHSNKQKQKDYQSMRLPARFVTHPELRATFEADHAARKEKEQADAAKQAQKKAENDARTVKINQNAVTKNFDAPLSSYKLKDDFLTIAQALGLTVEKKDTIASLTNKIKTHLDEHPALADNARFSALFQVGGVKRRIHSRPATPLSKDSAPTTSSTSHLMPSPAPHFQVGFGSLPPVSQPPAGLEHTWDTPPPPSNLQYQSHSSATNMSHESYTPPTYSFAAHSFIPYRYPSHI